MRVKCVCVRGRGEKEKRKRRKRKRGGDEGLWEERSTHAIEIDLRVLLFVV